jgi:endonuclease YncB( thermonuclease family)
MTTREYAYRISAVEKVTDGDTFWLRLDVGFRETLLVDCRLDGWDCPETNRGSDYEKQQAKVAKQVTADFLTNVPTDAVLWVRTEKDPDDFGRWLGDVWQETPDGTQTHLGGVLGAQQLASVWPTRWHEEYDTTLETS